MLKFWSLCEKSVIVSGVIAIALVGTVCFMATQGVEVPTFLSLAMGTVLGYFFGTGKPKAAVDILKA